MEQLETTVLCLRTSADKIMNATFVTVLGPESLFSIKLPTNLEKYRFANQISPLYLLDVELIKTKKNWILKNINRFETLATISNYAQITALSEIVKTILRYVREDQETDILPFVTRYISENIMQFDGADFEALLLEQLGFSSQNTGTIQEQTKKAKLENDLREYRETTNDLPKKNLDSTPGV